MEQKIILYNDLCKNGDTYIIILYAYKMINPNAMLKTAYEMNH